MYPSYGSSSSSSSSGGGGGSGSGSGGGYYSDNYGDDYGIDVYATSSSNPSLARGGGLSEDSAAEAADSSSTRATVETGQSSRGQRGQGQLPSSVFDLLNTVNRGAANGQWANTDDGRANSGWAANNGDLFDLVTGGDQSASGVSGSTDRASERHVLAPRDPPSSGSRQSPALDSSRPVVPTSTTTPAPEFVMINPTTGA